MISTNSCNTNVKEYNRKIIVKLKPGNWTISSAGFHNEILIGSLWLGSPNWAKAVCVGDIDAILRLDLMAIKVHYDKI